MKKLCFTLLLSFSLLIVLSACAAKDVPSQKQEESEITISAAASLNDALKEIKTTFEKKHKNIHLSINLGGTGALQQQIIQGAPVDVFISAAKDKFDDLIQKGLIKKEDSKDLLGNKLVLITPKRHSAIQSFSDLSDNRVSRVAIGTPATVPAGMYAKQALQKYQVWDKLTPKLIQAKDVRQVLTYVETGSVDAGIVYLTDAKVSNKVKIVETASEDMHDPIIYPAGIIKETKHHKEAAIFLKYLKSTSAKKTFEKYGFIVLD
ncbi:molybdate ABC transporter substrate-binding protein [Bacillus sp. C11]|nr:molybdate ABC transporter substrate-binding protein [Neobacillus terrae]NHM29413.1 molybdate ABC transporter substrate-binding protein [Neobacillus terrae]